MNDTITELLARIEMLEADIDEVRQHLDQTVVFVGDMDLFQGVTDIELLEAWDVDSEVEQ